MNFRKKELIWEIENIERMQCGHLQVSFFSSFFTSQQEQNKVIRSATHKCIYFFPMDIFFLIGLHDPCNTSSNVRGI